MTIQNACPCCRQFHDTSGCRTPVPIEERRPTEASKDEELPLLYRMAEMLEYIADNYLEIFTWSYIDSKKMIAEHKANQKGADAVNQNKFKYWLEEEGSCNDFYKVETCWGSENLEYVAQAAARDFHANRDGWEHHWPLRFVIANETGVPLGTFLVHREHEPSFSAVKV